MCKSSFFSDTSANFFISSNSSFEYKVNSLATFITNISLKYFITSHIKLYKSFPLSITSSNICKATISSFSIIAFANLFIYSKLGSPTSSFISLTFIS